MFYSIWFVFKSWYLHKIYQCLFLLPLWDVKKCVILYMFISKQTCYNLPVSFVSSSLIYRYDLRFRPFKKASFLSLRASLLNSASRKIVFIFMLNLMYLTLFKWSYLGYIGLIWPSTLIKISFHPTFVSMYMKEILDLGFTRRSP